MRFLVDECAGPALARWLRDRGHDVYSIYEDSRGIDDNAVITRAVSEGRILITNDKDFGDKVYRDRQIHAGIVLLRLRDDSSSGKIAAMRALLESHSERLERSFVVVTDKGVRFSRL